MVLMWIFIRKKILDKYLHEVFVDVTIIQIMQCLDMGLSLVTRQTVLVKWPQWSCDDTLNSSLALLLLYNVIF